MKNFYQILGVEINCTEDEIKTAYRKLSTKFHPDKNFGDKYFEDRFKDIQLAYETLINKNSRHEYNNKFFNFQEKHIQNPTESVVRKQQQSEDVKQNLNINQKNWIKSIFSSFENILIILLLASGILAYILNSWFGVFIIFLLFISIYWFIETIRNPSSNRTLFQLMFVFFGAPVFAIYLVIQIYGYLFPNSKQKDKESRKSEVVNIKTVNPIKFIHLENGSSPLESCFGKNQYEGEANITFKNGQESDAIICLVDVISQTTIRNEYVQSGTYYTMKKIPSGTYYLKTYYGNDWDSEKINFCGTKGAFNFDEIFSKSDAQKDLIRIENSKDNYTVGEITLYKVKNGNMGSKQINSIEFK